MKLTARIVVNKGVVPKSTKSNLSKLRFRVPHNHAAVQKGNKEFPFSSSSNGFQGKKELISCGGSKGTKNPPFPYFFSSTASSTHNKLLGSSFQKTFHQIRNFANAPSEKKNPEVPVAASRTPVEADDKDKKVPPKPTEKSPGEKPFLEKSPDEVRSWFETARGGEFKDYATNFRALSGKSLAGLTKEDFLRRCPELGDVIYNAIQEELKKPQQEGVIIEGEIKSSIIPPASLGKFIWRTELDTILTKIRDQIESIFIDKRMINWFPIGGLSGSGKTELAFEVIRQLKTEFEDKRPFLVTSFTESGQEVQDMTPLHGVELLLVEVENTHNVKIGERSKQHPKDRLHAFLEKWLSLSKNYHPEKRGIWIVHIDEFQASPSKCRAILRAIRDWNIDFKQKKVFIVPILSGTTAFQVAVGDLSKITDYEPFGITLGLMTKNKEELFDLALQQANIEKSSLLYFLKEELGGWPMAYNFLANARVNKRVLTQQDCDDLYRDLRYRMSEKYGNKDRWIRALQSHTEGMQKLLLLAASGLKVFPTHKINGITVAEAAITGVISHIDERVIMPLMLFRILNNIPEFRIINGDLEPSDKQWNQLEVIGIASLMIRARALREVLKKEVVSYEELRPNAIIGSAVSQFKFRLPSAEELKRYILLESSVFSILTNTPKLMLKDLPNELKPEDLEKYLKSLATKPCRISFKAGKQNKAIVEYKTDVETSSVLEILRNGELGKKIVIEEYKPNREFNTSVDFSNLPVPYLQHFNGIKGVMLIACEDQPGWDYLGYFPQNSELPNSAIVGQAKLRDYVDIATGKLTDPEAGKIDMNSLEEIHDKAIELAKENNLNQIVLEIFSTKKLPNRYSLPSHIAIIHQDQWKDNAGPIFSQLLYRAQ